MFAFGGVSIIKNCFKEPVKEDNAATFTGGKDGNCLLKSKSNRCYSVPFSPKALSFAECEAKREALGIKHCRFNYDYWAGAVDKCGGVENLPSDKDLLDIANLIYQNAPLVSFDEDNDAIIYASETASKYGLNEPPFSLWSNKEEDLDTTPYGRFAHFRHFSTVGTFFYYDQARNSSVAQAVCLQPVGAKN